jgi:hypothetical protein
MAWNPLPQSWFENLTDDDTDITVPIATFPALTAAELDGATGDIRKVLYAICEKAWSRWSAIATADRPTKMTIAKSSSVDTITGTVTNVFTFTFRNTIVSQDVADEA